MGVPVLGCGVCMGMNIGMDICRGRCEYSPK